MLPSRPTSTAATSPGQTQNTSTLSTPTILVTSGTLVGKVILDALEGRRGGVRLVACNAAADSPNLQRFDAVFAVPATCEAGWEEAVTAIIATEAPAVVIPGRDTDVKALACLAQTLPGLARTFMGCSVRMANVMMDKAATAAFAAEHGLAFVPTVSTDALDSTAAAAALAYTHGFPLIAKPARGAGSLGVRVLTCAAHLAAAAQVPGMVIQPYLDCPAPPTLDLDLSCGIPLFWDVPEDRMYSVQFMINKAGKITGHSTQRGRLVRGRVEEMWAFQDDALFEVAYAFALAVVKQGWRGALNVQAKRSMGSSGSASTPIWQVIELNGLFSGGTSCRLRLGFDEVGTLINEWVGRSVVPPLPAGQPPVTHVMRQLSDFPVSEVKLEASAPCK